MSKPNAQEIDIDRIIYSKAGKKAGYIPGFVISLLKRMIHIDFINTYLRQGYEGVEFCDKCLEYLDVKIETEGLENLCKEGCRYTFVSNHPLGAIDGVTLGKVLGKHYNGKIKYLVNDLLMNLKGLAPLCVPINKTGRQSRNLPKLIDEAFNSDNQMIMFPAGICSRKIGGKIQDHPWTKAFITKSIESKRDIVPIYFAGRNSERFYRIANWCKFLHIKFNLAMLFLPSEMYRSRGGTYKITIGKPVPWETFTKDMTPQQWAQEVRKKVYELSD